MEDEKATLGSLCTSVMSATSGLPRTSKAVNSSITVPFVEEEMSTCTLYGSKGDSHLRNIGVVMQMAGLRKGWSGTSKELGRCGGEEKESGNRGGGGRGRKEKGRRRREGEGGSGGGGRAGEEEKE